jgi:hypothetical protein
MKKKNDKQEKSKQEEEIKLSPSEKLAVFGTVAFMAGLFFGVTILLEKNKTVEINVNLIDSNKKKTLAFGMVPKSYEMPKKKRDKISACEKIIEGLADGTRKKR